MDDKEKLYDNDREWRRYLVKQFEKMDAELRAMGKDIARIKVWNLVFRVTGGALFTAVFSIILVWMEKRLF